MLKLYNSTSNLLRQGENYARELGFSHSPIKLKREISEKWKKYFALREAKSKGGKLPHPIVTFDEVELWIFPNYQTNMEFYDVLDSLPGKHFNRFLDVPFDRARWSSWQKVIEILGGSGSVILMQI